MPDSAPDMNDPRFSRDLSLDGERHKVAALLALLEQQGFGDDDDIILTAIEGETDAFEAVSKVLRLIAEDEARSDALRALEGQYSARRARYDERVKFARLALLKFMQDFGLKRIERPEATLSISKPQQRVAYATDFEPESLPVDLRKITVEADRTKVSAFIKDGGELAGVYLTNGEPSLTLRTK
jgi:hypothetical protein